MMTKFPRNCKKGFVRLLVLVGLLAGSTKVTYSAQRDPNLQVVIDTFMWFNQTQQQHAEPITKQDVAKHFTKDAQMMTNNRLVCTGIDEHYDHFLEINGHYQFLQVDFENFHSTSVGNIVFLDYRLIGIDASGQEDIIHVMGHMVIKAGKIALFKEVIFHESA